MSGLLMFAQIASACLALLVTGLMAAGFVRLAWNAGGMIRHMATGIVLIHAAVFLRTVHRSIGPVVLSEDSALVSPIGESIIALMLNALIVLAGWHGLRALYLAIPEPRRGRYSLLTAALYPPLRRR